MDSSTPQRVTLSDGKMSIAGIAARFVQAPARRLKLEAIGLEALSGYVLRDGVFVAEARVSARGWLPEDGLARAGLAEEAGEIALVVKPLPEGGGLAGRILLVLAHGGEEPDFHATLWLPAEIFTALRGDVEAGRAGRLSLIATTSLWLDEADRDVPQGRPVAWRLGPEADGEGTTPARGLVERIDWGPALAAPQPEQAAVAEEQVETTSEALGKINWSLKQIIFVLLVLMIIAALK